MDNINKKPYKKDSLKTKSIIINDTKTNNYELSTILFNFCLEELEKYRNIITNHNTTYHEKDVASNILRDYLKTAENLCKLVDKE